MMTQILKHNEGSDEVRGGESIRGGGDGGSNSGGQNRQP